MLTLYSVGTDGDRDVPEHVVRVFHGRAFRCRIGWVRRSPKANRRLERVTSASRTGTLREPIWSRGAFWRPYGKGRDQAPQVPCPDAALSGRQRYGLPSPLAPVTTPSSLCSSVIAAPLGSSSMR